MINLIDLILGALILFYLLKHAGGMVGTLKNIAFVIIFLMLFGIAAQFVLNLSFAKKVHGPLENSYTVKISHVLIRGLYPVIEWSAGKLDGFIKDKIIAKPAPDVSIPKVTVPKKMPTIVIPKDSMPKLKVDELPKLK
ncbi:hypothetical protein ACFL31_02160 [Candidatus Margulisiibacteriota bacterium]